MRAPFAAIVALTALAHLPTARADAPPDDFRFELLAPPAPASPALDLTRLDQKVKLRRRMLLAHQALGFLALSTAGFRQLFAELDFDDRFTDGGGHTGKWRPYRLALDLGATVAFAAAGSLALFAPSPYDKPMIRADTAGIHKICMAFATAGVVAQAVLQPIAELGASSSSQRAWSLAALVTGYVTYAFMATGWIAYFF